MHKYSTIKQIEIAYSLEVYIIRRSYIIDMGKRNNQTVSMCKINVFRIQIYNVDLWYVYDAQCPHTHTPYYIYMLVVRLATLALLANL